ncbi:MAG: hypothetical protein F6K50_28615 [Moorea sp. SIO3I7]|uniref:hypothetical protein n=1 Tax=unclassified Moorena TaxID=2683338 RepID=UPI0013BF4FF0|nr:MULTISPECIES: hypothetical protein [unclassified Moorena]NEN99305.1 hypothetical protein [Moorena sp. SIO3I7]NEO05960.1 hypothetical protein [Moorena sp. SIO3I8]NEO22401.1 hypothetical protein [Moorena sp. SIO4A5]NEP24516.1 hypothetical protein [Moorena sp. SIO3I6]NEQ61552.1 hypothetical protein [Moorena sp. SIO4A1]
MRIFRKHSAISRQLSGIAEGRNEYEWGGHPARLKIGTGKMLIPQLPTPYSLLPTPYSLLPTPFPLTFSC